MSIAENKKLEDERKQKDKRISDLKKEIEKQARERDRERKEREEEKKKAERVARERERKQIRSYTTRSTSTGQLNRSVEYPRGYAS